MATVNVNTVQRRFEDSGVFEVNNGTDDLVVANTMPGTVRVTLPKRTAIEHVDRGVQQQPVQGDDELGELEVTLKAGKKTGNDLMTALNTTPTGTNLVKEYIVTIDIPDNRGASTGDRFTTANAFLAQQMELQTGAEFDQIRVRMKFRTGAWATY